MITAHSYWRLRMLRTRKPRNQRSKRALGAREPKLVEVEKNTLVMRGHHGSHTVNELLRDIYTLQKPNAKHFVKKNNVLPFEDATKLEFLLARNDCSLFALGNHTKKRPNNLVLGRTFDGHLLDMVELGIVNFKAMNAFKSGDHMFGVGNKPCLLFCGPDFEQVDTFVRLKNLLIDFFRGPVVDQVNLAGLDHVLVCTAVQGKLLLRLYAVQLKSSGTRLPRVELVEIGPQLDLTPRRTQWASAEMAREAMRRPKAVKPMKKKNVEQSGVGDKLGRVHVGRQELDKMALRKFKGTQHKRTREETGGAEPGAATRKRTKGADGTV